MMAEGHEDAEKRENLAWNLSSRARDSFSLSTTATKILKKIWKITYPERLWGCAMPLLCYCLWYICLEKCDNLLTFWHFYSVETSPETTSSERWSRRIIRSIEPTFYSMDGYILLFHGSEENESKLCWLCVDEEKVFSPNKEPESLWWVYAWAICSFHSISLLSAAALTHTQFFCCWLSFLSLI